jgi:hypothetical protein
MHYNNKDTKRFISFLINQWDNYIQPITSDEGRRLILNVEKLKDEANSESSKYPLLASKGEYSIKFLYLIAKLLMIQEKTNYTEAFMFRALLKALEDQKDIYKIVRIATQTRRNK